MSGRVCVGEMCVCMCVCVCVCVCVKEEGRREGEESERMTCESLSFSPSSPSLTSFLPESLSPLLL